jgi:PleD family two-component response regulator
MAAIATRRPTETDVGQPPTVAVAMAPMGVPRVLFSELAAREWARARRYGNGAALLVVNVDRAARLYQARGPRATDAVLAALLRETAPMLRSADLLTRYSESEMAVFLSPADATGALDVAERIRERIEQLEVLLPVHHPHQVAPPAPTSPGAQPAQPLRVTVSIGVAHLRPAHLNLQALLDDAENAAVAARHAGGNCVRAAPLELSHPSAAGDERDGQWTEPKA